MKADRVVDLTVKELSETLSNKEADELERLLAEDTEHQKVYEQTIKRWHQSALFTLSAKADTEASWEVVLHRLNEQVDARIFTLSPIFKVAAIVIITAGLGLFLFNPWSVIEFETGAGETLNITLDDHSVITLNESSRLELSRDFNETQRLIKFVGEAYFEIAKNPEKPFVIRSGVSEIEVLGTSFNVDAKNNNEIIEVDVTSGRVSLSEFGNPTNLTILTSGMKGKLNTFTGEVISSSVESPNFLAWQTRQLVFEDLSISQVLDDVNEYFNVKVFSENPAILDCKFTSSFSNPSLVEVLEIISLALDVDFQISEREIILTGVGCTETKK